MKAVINQGGIVKSCGGCSEARGIDTLNFISGVELSNMKEFSKLSFEADKVLTF